MGLAYRNRVAEFVNQMSSKPIQITPYKSNPFYKGVGKPFPDEMKKITAFALDPTTTRTGIDFNLKPQFGSTIVKNGSIGKNVSLRSNCSN